MRLSLPLIPLVGLVVLGNFPRARAADPATAGILQRLDRLEQENRELRQRNERLEDHVHLTVRPLPPPEYGPGLPWLNHPYADYDYSLYGPTGQADLGEAILQLGAGMERLELARIDSSIPQPANASGVDDRELRVRWDNGLRAESANGAFRLHVGGRLQFDNSWYSQDDNLLLGIDDGQRLKDGTVFRRARFRVDGRFSEFIDFVTEVNFAAIQDAANIRNDAVKVGSVGLTDFYVTFRDQPLVGNIRLGHFIAPLSLERYSGSNVSQYMERSHIVEAFVGPNEYQSGILFFDSLFDDLMTYGTSFTWVGKDTVNSFAFGAFPTGQYAVNARLSASPIYRHQGRRLVHVGAGYLHQALDGNRFGTAIRPLVRAGAGGDQTPNVVSTGRFFTPNGADALVVEGAIVLGPFSLSSEYALASVTDLFEDYDGVTYSGPRGDATYHAAYIEGGIFLTPGDYRRYDRTTGTWARVTPVNNVFYVRGEDGCRRRGTGAVELVSRYTFLDLVGGSPTLTPTSGARAGRVHDLTLGVNWYLNSQTRLIVNYVHTRIDSIVSGASGDFDGLGCRVHLDF